MEKLQGKIIKYSNLKEKNNMELKNIQKEVFNNKLEKGFNTTDINKEFCFLYGEVSEKINQI